MKKSKFAFPSVLFLIFFSPSLIHEFDSLKDSFTSQLFFYFRYWEAKNFVSVFLASHMWTFFFFLSTQEKEIFSRSFPFALILENWEKEKINSKIVYAWINSWISCKRPLFSFFLLAIALNFTRSAFFVAIYCRN